MNVLYNIIQCIADITKYQFVPHDAEKIFIHFVTKFVFEYIHIPSFILLCGHLQLCGHYYW
jgi:hypothetical protein